MSMLMVVQNDYHVRLIASSFNLLNYSCHLDRLFCVRISEFHTELSLVCKLCSKALESVVAQSARYFDDTFIIRSYGYNNLQVFLDHVNRTVMHGDKKTRLHIILIQRLFALTSIWMLNLITSGPKRRYRLSTSNTNYWWTRTLGRKTLSSVICSEKIRSWMYWNILLRKHGSTLCITSGGNSSSLSQD